MLFIFFIIIHARLGFHTLTIPLFMAAGLWKFCCRCSCRRARSISDEKSNFVIPPFRDKLLFSGSASTTREKKLTIAFKWNFLKNDVAPLTSFLLTWSALEKSWNRLRKNNYQKCKTSRRWWLQLSAWVGGKTALAQNLGLECREFSVLQVKWSRAIVSPHKHSKNEFHFGSDSRPMTRTIRILEKKKCN